MIMDLIHKIKYIVDENDKRIAVQMDIDVFEAIESFIEDNALAKAIEESLGEETVSLEATLKYLKELEKIDS